MKIIAQIIPSKPDGLWPPLKVFHVRLAPGLRYFGHEEIVTRHIGPRPWSEMWWFDNGYMHLVYSRH